ncbi:MAG TPA: Dabb family protein [Pirellulales bacterium]
MTRLVLLAAAAMYLTLNSTHAAEPLVGKDARIVFLGDSITQAGNNKGGYVDIIRQTFADKYKDWNVEVIGAGISGNKINDLQGRLDRDVISKKPTHVVIYIGINDVWHSTRGQGTSKEAFEAGLKDVIGKISAAGAQPILSTASVIGEKHDGSNPLDPMLDEYCDISRKVAADTKTPLIDLNKAFRDHLKANNEKNVDKGVLTSDTVHLNAAGNQFVADVFLKGLLEPSQPAAAPASAEKQGKMLRHVVLFKFKADLKPEEVEEVVAAFKALPQKIDAIADFECGTDVSVEGKAEGFTHGFVVTFKDAAARDVYLPHPQHQEFVKLVGPRLDKALVFDYWTE